MPAGYIKENYDNLMGRGEPAVFRCQHLRMPRFSPQDREGHLERCEPVILEGLEERIHLFDLPRSGKKNGTADCIERWN